MVKVSVIVPVYNVEKYLSRCLDSILSNSFYDIEIICVNDGSTDDSLKILNSYEKMDNRVKIITQNNQGLSSARNTGLKYTQGEYTMFVDSDDFISTNTISLLYDIITNNNLDVLMFAYSEGENEQIIKVVTSPNLQEIGVFNIDNINPDIYKFLLTPTWCKIYKSSLIKHLRFVPYLYEDNAYWADVFLQCKRIAYINQPFYFYTQRQGSIMSYSDDRVLDIIKVFDYIDNRFKQKNKYYTYKNVLSLIRFMEYYRKYIQCGRVTRKKFYNVFRNTNINVKCNNKYEQEVIKTIIKAHTLSFTTFEEYINDKCNNTYIQ